MLCHDIAERDVVLRRFPYPASHWPRSNVCAPDYPLTQLYHSRLRHSYHAPMKTEMPLHGDIRPVTKQEKTALNMARFIRSQTLTLLEKLNELDADEQADICESLHDHADELYRSCLARFGDDGENL